MGQPIPRQHPAVVLRAHYDALRALLAVAMVAVTILAGTVVALATDDDAARAGSATSHVIPTGPFGRMSDDVALRRAAVHPTGGKASPGVSPNSGPPVGVR